MPIVVTIEDALKDKEPVHPLILFRIIPPTQHVLIRHGKNTLYKGALKHMSNAQLNLILLHKVQSIKPTRHDNTSLLVIYVC